MKRIIVKHDMKTEELLEKYSFLKVKNPGYSTTWTNCWLDDLEPGWRKAFGEELCKELDQAIKADKCENTFEFIQIKEKFAGLRLYADGYGENTRDVLSKYEELSKYICGHCGEPAVYITKGWFYPLCNHCIKNVNSGYVPIHEFYGFNSYNEVQDEIKRIKTDFQYDRYWKIIRR